MWNIVMKNWVSISFYEEFWIRIYEWKKKPGTEFAGEGVGVKSTIRWKKRLASLFYLSWIALKLFWLFPPFWTYFVCFFSWFLPTWSFSITFLCFDFCFSEISVCLGYLVIYKTRLDVYPAMFFMSCNVIVKY